MNSPARAAPVFRASATSLAPVAYASAASIAKAFVFTDVRCSAKRQKGERRFACNKFLLCVPGEYTYTMSETERGERTSRTASYIFCHDCHKQYAIEFSPVKR